MNDKLIVVIDACLEKYYVTENYNSHNILRVLFLLHRLGLGKV